MAKTNSIVDPKKLNEPDSMICNCAEECKLGKTTAGLNCLHANSHRHVSGCFEGYCFQIEKNVYCIKVEGKKDE